MQLPKKQTTGTAERSCLISRLLHPHTCAAAILRYERYALGLQTSDQGVRIGWDHAYRAILGFRTPNRCNPNL